MNDSVSDPRNWQHYMCPGPHGMWLALPDPATRSWLLALEIDQAPWTVAAERPLCLWCGQDLLPVADLEALVHLERSNPPPR